MTLIYRLWLMVKANPGITRKEIRELAPDITREQLRDAVYSMRKCRYITGSGKYHNPSYQCGEVVPLEDGRGSAPGSLLGRAAGARVTGSEKWHRGLSAARKGRRDMAPKVLKRVPFAATELERCWGWVPKAGFGMDVSE